MVWTIYTLVEQCVYLIIILLYIWRSYSLSFVLYYCRRHLDLQMNHTQGWHCTSESCIVHCTMFYSWSTSKGGIVPCTIVPRVAGGAVLSSSGFVIPDLSRIYCHGPYWHHPILSFSQLKPIWESFAHGLSSFAKLVVASSSHCLIACLWLFLPSFHNDWL